MEGVGKEGRGKEVELDGVLRWECSGMFRGWLALRIRTGLLYDDDWHDPGLRGTCGALLFLHLTFPQSCGHRHHRNVLH